MDSAVVVENLSKTWRPPLGPPQPALSGLTLTIPRGAAFGLIGPNGAGKTTFIKLLLAVARPTGGTVEVLGGDPEDTRIRARVGYLPERMHLPAALSGGDFLRSVAALKRLRPSEAALRVSMERVGLGTTKQRIATYSKGMRQRLGLAAALLGGPDLLVLDEPTDGIDPVGRVELRELLVAERRRGTTLLVNSHLLAETERVCDRIGILDRGRLRLEGTLEEVRRSSTHWVARFAEGAPADRLREAGFVATGDGWAFTGPLGGPDAEALNAALDRARAAGARLVELAPSSRDLEQVLSETLERPL